MKPMTITIDDETLRLLDELATAARHIRSRSALVRAAIREFVERERRSQLEERERDILRKHRRKLDRQVRALIREQARP